MKQHQQYTLLNPCKYSFTDLIAAANVDQNLTELYAMSQSDRNDVVKNLCDKANWYWNDVLSGGVVYTAFSPHKI
jgi:hypothetical protein